MKWEEGWGTPTIQGTFRPICHPGPGTRNPAAFIARHSVPIRPDLSPCGKGRSPAGFGESDRSHQCPRAIPPGRLGRPTAPDRAIPPCGIAWIRPNSPVVPQEWDGITQWMGSERSITFRLADFPQRWLTTLRCQCEAGGKQDDDVSSDHTARDFGERSRRLRNQEMESLCYNQGNYAPYNLPACGGKRMTVSCLLWR